jgi:hypothetical protein
MPIIKKGIEKMANYRTLFCGKDILGIGQEGSFADYRERIKTCFDCKDCLFCKGAKGYFKAIILEQEKISILQSLTN